MHHALQLVEIRINIRHYLRIRDLKQCILVCRDWWCTFEPLICNETSVRLRRHESVFGPQGQPTNDDEWDQLNQHQDLSSTPRQPSAYSIVRHRHQVYSLGSFRLELAYIPFGNLRSIVLGSGDLNTNDLAPWFHFLQGCKDSLQELELVGFRTLPEAHFWEMLMVLPRLRELQIHHGGIVEYDQARVFWKVCSRLESLKLRQTYFTHLTGTSYPYPDLSNVKELFLSNIGMEFDRQARIVAQCGQLRRLWWRTPQISEVRNGVIPHIEEAILSRRLSRLEGMRIELRPKEFAGSFLSSWLKRVGCTLSPGKPWSPETLFTIRDYFPQLTEFRIDDSANKGRRLSLLLLMSCPNLRTVTAPLLKVSEIMELTPQGWACTGLRRLSVYFEVDRVSGTDDDKDGEECNRFILHHLSTLTELEVLLLNGPDKDYEVRLRRNHFQGNLKVCLASGLDILAGLKYLRGVSLPGHQSWTRAELDWVKEHWTRLTDLAGINKHNKNAAKGLEGEVKARRLLSVEKMEDFKGLYPANLVSIFHADTKGDKQPPSRTFCALPELIDLLGPELDPIDLASSVRVSRLWYHVLTLYLWSVVNESRCSWPMVLSTNDSESVQACLFKYGSFIRELHVHSQAILDIVRGDGVCSKLRVLKFYDSTDKERGAQYMDPAGKDANLWDFVHSNKDLETLRFGRTVKGLVEYEGALVCNIVLLSLKNLVTLQDYTSVLEPAVILERFSNFRSFFGNGIDILQGPKPGCPYSDLVIGADELHRGTHTPCSLEPSSQPGLYRHRRSV
ncbi:hypothetical protein EC957_003640 [Mortierella hygrophila]|uniref:F-box domain-containing protein n=1 Tax=Mortierella hygrophila TaxID=979708 RepID=A0A9P6F1L9_9FUNG|nr:hypothetical protein EC957_003640 [Mortierella hygrophila]